MTKIKRLGLYNLYVLKGIGGVLNRGEMGTFQNETKQKKQK